MEFDRIPGVVAQLHVKMTRDGKVYVSAPHSNRGLCHMLLELARHQIDKECDRLESSPIQRASADDIPRIPRNG
jgi:hypothetical protein